MERFELCDIMNILIEYGVDCMETESNFKEMMRPNKGQKRAAKHIKNYGLIG